MIRADLTSKTAETLSSFLIIAAERFKEDAAMIRAELKGKPHAGLEAIAAQFDAQEVEARRMSAQFGQGFEFDIYPARDRRSDVLTIDPAQEG